MDQDMTILVERLVAIPGYQAAFERAYPGEGITEKTIAKALASFERTIVSANAPFDRWHAGDKKAVDESAKRGFKLFTGKAKCDVCHEGFNFTDNGFHNIGLKTPKGLSEDVGRYAQRKVKVNKGAFKTPTLRDVALNGPYMHNGMYRTLEEVVDHYDRGGDVKDNLDPNMETLNLAPQEKQDLVAFLKSLTGAPLLVTIPQLPR
jgi:cytochrome c peroxidase